ncbi:MAG: carboxypeptidase regulatory-like domain-containing protein [Bacteroidales bacterium]|nr:carboxypeptidase regulatory-like domain-containing protein [Bacteroidales bacterium]
MKRFFALMLIALSLTVINESCKPEPEEELGSIYGIITDKATGEPVKNANVQLRPSGETSLTGNDGRYEFLDLKSGDYSITVSKTGYTDLIDDYVITVDGSKAMRRDVQIEKLPAALKILDDNGNDIDSLDFGSNIDDVSRLFNIFNNGVSVLKYEVLKTASWITSLSSTEGSLQPGATKPIVVGIDRTKLSVGENTTTLHVTSDNGSKQLVVKAFKLGDVVTLDPINVTLSSAMLRGNVNKDISYSQKGFSFWSDSDDATNLVVEGNSVGEFVYHVTNLEEQTTYYYRAYMICNNETIYGEQKSFKTAESIDKPIVVSKDVTNITQTTATCGGNVTSNGGATVTARGVCWGEIQNPNIDNIYCEETTDGNGTGSFTSYLTNLKANTTYYVRAYATNEKGTTYGEQKSFTTLPEIELPTVTTYNVSSITQTTASCGGYVTSDGNATVTARGVCWSTSSNPTIDNNHTTDGTGTGSFTSNLTGLTANTTYYVRAYATNEKGTSYGEEKSFTTMAYMPTVVTYPVTDYSETTATFNGNVVSDGGASVTARGFCWNTSPNPTINNNYNVEGSGNGEFTSNITGLNDNTTYYVRAYATNETGTSYGEEVSFTTEAEETTGSINGYDWVDLGLPSGLKWATCNVGASSPEEYGDYFAWGETSTKSTYTNSNSLTYGLSISQLQSQGYIDGGGNLTSSHDAATANWGGSWRMPTKEEQQELVDECTWEWTTQNGVNGCKVTGPNGNCIFLPAAGYRYGSSLDDGGNYGRYWSSAPFDDISDFYAFSLDFNSDAEIVYSNNRNFGQPVRPVSE